MPHFVVVNAKFIKALIDKKRRYEQNEIVMVLELASVVLQRDLSPKLRDLGSFNFNIAMGDNMVSTNMLDFGASINFMPYLV